jgi:hypothetical protein
MIGGCGTSAPSPQQSGARISAERFFRAIVAKDWEAAYSILDGENNRELGLQRFSQLAAGYRSGLRFEPSAATVTACDEQGDQAVAHVILTGRAAAHQRFKDVVTLRCKSNGWAVILPYNFGQSRGQ